MSKYTAALSAQNTNAKVFDVHKPRNGSESCLFTLGVYGTFGTGTVTVNLSPDGGITLLPLAPINGSSPSITANGAYTFKVGNGDKIDDYPSIYVAIGAATNPDLDIVAWDNN